MVNKIKQFIAKYHSNDLPNGKFSVTKRSKRYMLKLEYKLGLDNFLLTELDFDSLSEIDKLIGYNISEYPYVAQYVDGGETLNIEKVYNDDDEQLHDCVSLGQGKQRLFVYENLQQMDDSIASVQITPVKDIAYRFMDERGRSVQISKIEDELPYNMRFETAQGNLVGFINVDQPSTVMDVLFSVGLYNEIDEKTIDTKTANGQSIRITRTNDQFKIDIQKEMTLNN